MGFICLRYKRNEKDLTAPYAVTSTNTNKCPHGFPVGTCPICSGMSGGASKDRSKPRKAGEMSYNECMAEWRRMQAQQKADMQEKIEAKRELLSQLFSTKPIINIEKLTQLQQKVMNFVEKLPPIIKTPVSFVLNVVNKVVNFAAGLINNVQSFIVNTAQNLANMVRSVVEKLPVVLAEVKNIIVTSFEQIILKPTKIILTLFIDMENKNNNKNKKDDKNKRKLKKIIEKFFGFVFKIKDDSKKQSKQHI